MTRFPSPTHTMLRCRGRRDWDTVSAQRMDATAGRHAAAPQTHDRIVLYETGGVAAACQCEGLRRTHILAPGMLDIIPAGASGAWEDAAPVAFVSVRLAPGVIAAMANAVGVCGALEISPRLGVRDPVLEHIARALAAEMEAPEPGARIYVESLGVALGARLLQAFSAAGAPRRRTLSKPQMRRVLGHLEANLSDDLSLASIAEVAQLSVPHLTAMFRRTTGQSVHRYIMERRVSRARDLLRDDELTTAYVAQACGFAHASHLARWTRRILGRTPAQLRNS